MQKAPISTKPIRNLRSVRCVYVAVTASKSPTRVPRLLTAARNNSTKANTTQTTGGGPVPCSGPFQRPVQLPGLCRHRWWRVPKEHYSLPGSYRKGGRNTIGWPDHCTAKMLHRETNSTAGSTRGSGCKSCVVAETGNCMRSGYFSWLAATQNRV